MIPVADAEFAKHFGNPLSKVTVIMKTLDQLLANEKPEVVARAQEKAADILLEISLADTQKLTKQSQEHLNRKPK